MKLFQPRRDDSISFVEELRRRDEALGLQSRYVVWGPKAEILSDDEKAKIILHNDWCVARGHHPTLKNFDRLTFGDSYRRMKAGVYRGLDWVFGIKSPYM